MDETMDDLVATLPDEVRAEIDRPKIQQQETLNALGIAIAKLRDEAIAARKESGIEDTWRECEEAYYGVDDVTGGTAAIVSVDLAESGAALDALIAIVGDIAVMYPLAGIQQAYPGAGSAPIYPLAGAAQDYPLAGVAQN